MWVMVIVVYALLIIYEFIPLYKQKLWNDFWVNSVLYMFSFAVALLLSLGIKIPSPSGPIIDFLSSMFGK